MRFSVLLPTHNRPDVLEPALQSVLAQSHEDFEVLVVGDGCSDNTAQVVAGFDDARIRWFDLPKARGFGYANRNIALRQATGDLIAFLGHDNLLFPDHLEWMARKFTDSDAQIAYSRPLWIRDDGLIVPSFVNLKLPKPMHSFLNQTNVLPATTVVHRRSCFEQVGYWPEDVNSSGDHVLWKRILKAYGEGSLRFQRSPTCLHFRADWRDPKRWAPPPVAYIGAIFDAGRFWPPGLKLEVDTDGARAQAQVWAQIAERPAAFMESVRHGTVLAQDMLAWNAGMDPSF